MDARTAAVLCLLCHGAGGMTDDGDVWGATPGPREDSPWGEALPPGEAERGAPAEDGGGGGGGGGGWEAWPEPGAGWSGAAPPDGCRCWNATDEDRRLELECRCSGDELADVPRTLHRQLSSLTLTKSLIKVVKKDSFQPYKDTIKDITLADLSELKKIERGAFRNLRQLRTVYITETPSLKILPPKIFDGLPATFRTLRIVRTGLEAVPDMAGIGSESIVHMIDLESNRFKRLKTNLIKVKAERLLLSYNAIESVDGWAFNGSEIAKLSLSGNKRLSQLSMDSFRGLKNLQDLDLSQTAITALPVIGLEHLEILRIKDTESLKVIPSVYDFKSLQEAHLTYSFHCCAFKFPAKHDPSRHARHQEYLAKMRQFCDTGQTTKHERRRRQWGPPLADSFPGSKAASAYGDYDSWEEDRGFGALAADDPGTDSGGGGGGAAPGAPASGGSEEDAAGRDLGHFHQTTAAAAPKRLHALCGHLSAGQPAVVCRPRPDALNPCEDIMGYTWLRVCVWFVVVTAVLGNLAVLAVLLSYLRDLTVPRFLMCHLAFADLCMGVYLLTLASMDLRSSQFYFNFAYDWQIGYGCQVAGFLTVFASQLSIYTLSILTLERWFAITYAIYLNKRLKLRDAAYAMALGWVYSIVMAVLPLAGVNGYSATSICLPMRVRGSADVAYLACLLLINFVAFLVLVVCYVQIYLSLGRDPRSTSHHRTRGEASVAKKMALLVFTDFACWAPIAFFSLTALAGYPLVDVTRSKILLVFFYPLNACANPYLYAILTAQYRKDLFLMLARYGMCTKIAQQYKMAYSLPTTNNSNNGPFAPRPSDSQAAGANHAEEVQLTITSTAPLNGCARTQLLTGCNGPAATSHEVFV